VSGTYEQKRDIGGELIEGVLGEWASKAAIVHYVITTE
jgi:hypothetical protein